MKIILASTSERRKKIFSMLSLHFTYIEPTYQEKDDPELSVREQAKSHAMGKAQSIAALHKNALVIGSDTLIELNHKKIGKPQNLTDAKNILAQLSNQTHYIHTALCLIDTQKQEMLQHLESIEVTFKKLNPEMIEQYLNTDDVLDKAGAYALQGHASQLIANINGDILAGIGLPLKILAKWLKEKHILFNEGFLSFYPNLKNML